MRISLLAVVTLALMVGAGANAADITFYRDIAPIVHHDCAPCHRPGESGPFSLLTYEDVKRHASQIAAVTKRRFMPPWLPEPGYGDFVEERRLSDAQIQLIADWVMQGAPAGSPADGPPAPTFSSEWQLGKPDLVLRVTRPYRLSADANEVFWNFVIPVPLKAARWVKAIELRPGNARVVHHASIILDRSHSAQSHEKIPGAGFAGMDLRVVETSFDPDSNFLAWKPGSAPQVEPDGMAWRADPGMDLVLNVHLRPSGKPELVSPSIGLYFTDKPRTKYAMLVELEHDGAIDIPAGERDAIVKDDFQCPQDLSVLAVYPHAHYLGKLLEGYATLPDGSRKWLIRIPDWDLSWQGVFHYRQPIFLPRGTVISMRYHYDNSAENLRNPNRPPKRVRGGSEANDEMGNLWLQVLPAGEGDQRAVLEEALMRHQLEKYPTDFSANFNLGDLLLAKGDAAGAIPYFDVAAKTDLRSPLAATELGVALSMASRQTEARQQFRRALEINPEYTEARFDLASIDAQSGDLEAAATGFQRVLAEKPDHPKARQHLGEVLFLLGDRLEDSGKHNEAAQRYREALKYRPDDAELHTSLGMILARMGQFRAAQPEFEAAVRIDPNFQPARRGLEAVQAQLKGR
jgi:tetratricopeptide (TPR) repeat protein